LKTSRLLVQQFPTLMRHTCGVFFVSLRGELSRKPALETIRPVKSWNAVFSWQLRMARACSNGCGNAFVWTR
jgi:hypothetical protein